MQDAKFSKVPTIFPYQIRIFTFHVDINNSVNTGYNISFYPNWLDVPPEKITNYDTNLPTICPYQGKIIAFLGVCRQNFSILSRATKGKVNPNWK